MHATNGKVQSERYEGYGYTTNAKLKSSDLNVHCRLNGAEMDFMKQAYERLELSARTYHKALRVARTIADLEGKEEIELSHLKEAVSYRMLDRKYWRSAYEM